MQDINGADRFLALAATTPLACQPRLPRVIKGFQNSWAFCFTRNVGLIAVPGRAPVNQLGKPQRLLLQRESVQ